MKTDKKLNETIYEFLQIYIKERQYSPSIREIGKACGGLSPSTVSYHLNDLESQGRIMRAWYKSRSIRLLESEEALDEVTEMVYEFINRYIQQEKIAPSQREIAEACHLSKTAVLLQLKRLEDDGRIKRGEGHRQIQIC